jgi:hypothetical protein
MSPLLDPFFNKNMFCDFGSLASNLKENLEEMQRLEHKTRVIQSLGKAFLFCVLHVFKDDMQKALDDMPELKKMNGTMSKHVKLTNEVSHTISSKGLMDVSVIEQNIVCQPANKNEHFKVDECMR